MEEKREEHDSQEKKERNETHRRRRGCLSVVSLVGEVMVLAVFDPLPHSKPN
jgi:hypothetical protein